MKHWLIGAATFFLATAAFAADVRTAEVVPALPVIPDRSFDITHYGAVGDGKTLNTKAVADTIAAATAAGGGRVVVPAGNFLVGRIRLASSMELRLETGSTLLLTDDGAAYRNAKGLYDNCITADDCHDLAITGGGTIDGSGQRWWDAFRKIKGTPQASLPEEHRPFMVVLDRCTRVCIDGVLLTNSPMFHLVPKSCTDVTINAVRFKAPGNAPNTDALDPSGWRYAITNCDFDVGDDCIAIKASGKPEGDKLSCEDFYVADCTFRRGHGLSIGGQTPGGLQRLTVRRCTFDGTDAGIRMKAARGSGGLVQDLTYEDITMKNVKVPIDITSFYPKKPEDPAADPAQPVTEKTPIWRNVRISRVTITDCPEAGRIFGLAEMPVEDFVLSHVTISSKKGLRVANAKGIRFEDSSITVTSGPNVIAKNAGVTGLVLTP